MAKEIETTRASKIIFFLLCGTIVFTTLAYGAVHQPTIAIFYLTMVAIAGLWAIDAFSSGAVRFNKSPIQIPLAAAFVYGFLQIVPFGSLAEIGGIDGIPRTISLEPFWTQVAALHFLAYLIFLAALLTFIDSAGRLKTIISFITIFGFAYAFFAVLQAFLSPNKIYGVYEAQFAVPFGSFVNRHNFAAYMEMTIAVPLGLLFTGAIGRDKRLIYITAIGLMGIALLLSGSRGGLVSLLAEIFFLVIITAQTKSAGRLGLKIAFAVALVATIIAGALLIGGESSLSRFAETASSNNFTTNRTHIWSITLDVIKNNLPFGTGYGAFGVAYTPYDSFNGLERVEQAHNDYLQIMADAGIVGLIIGAFFIFQLFRVGLRYAKTSDRYLRGAAAGALAGCFAVLVHSLFDFVLHTTAVALLFITLVSMVVVSGRDEFDDGDDSDKKRRRKKTPGVIPIEKGKSIKKATI